MTAVPAPPGVVRTWGLILGVVLLLPELVLAVLVVRQPIVVGLAGFAMTIGFVRLATTGYQVLRARTPPAPRGLLGVAGLTALIAGALLWSAVSRAVRALGDAAYAGAVAPPAAIGLNLLVIATLGLWLLGLVWVVGALAGAARGARRR